MTVTGISAPNRQPSKRAKGSFSNSRQSRGAKGKKDTSELKNALVFFLVAHLDKYNPRPWFTSKKRVRARLKSKIDPQIKADGRIKRVALRNDLAEQVVQRAVDAGYIRIYECPNAAGKFTSEVTKAGRLWLERLKANHPAKGKAAA